MDDPIWIVENTKLQEMSTETLLDMKNSRVVITDSNSGLNEVIRGLQKHV